MNGEQRGTGAEAWIIQCSQNPPAPKGRQACVTLGPIQSITRGCREMFMGCLATVQSQSSCGSVCVGRAS